MSFRKIDTWKESLGVSYHGGLDDLAFSHDGKRIAIADIGGPIHIVDYPSGQELGILRVSNYPYHLAWHLDDTILAVAEAGPRSLIGVVELWDTRTFQLQASVVRPSLGVPHPVAFSSDGKTLAVGGDSGVIELWHFDELLKDETVPHPAERDRSPGVPPPYLTGAFGTSRFEERRPAERGERCRSE